jgi:acetylornithine deacetylase/succinyl-diaminopimelate desuccinylase-like protein
MAYFELWVHGPSQDLHSGLFGGTVHNPAQVLCELIAGMHEANGHITLPGFYDKVRVLSGDERAELARAPHSDEAWRAQTGVPQLYGEAGYTTIERLGIRPTLEVCGISGGYTSEGTKTIVPARAMAKLSTRLVPYQDPEAVEEQLKTYVQAHVPPTVRWEVKRLALPAPAVLVERDTPGMRAASAALAETFGTPPILRLFGASVPVVSMAQQALGVDAIMLGFAILSEANAHSPNEHTHLPSYFKGTEAYVRFFQKFAG